MRKYAIVAALVCCLTVTLFMSITTSGNPTEVESNLYDPWADINGDGQIDMYDIGYEARRFGALGDPTKNVNVTNWPDCWLRVKHCHYDEYHEDMVFPYPYVWRLSFSTAGYKQFSLIVRELSGTLFATVDVYATINTIPGHSIKINSFNLNPGECHGLHAQDICGDLLIVEIYDNIMGSIGVAQCWVYITA